MKPPRLPGTEKFRFCDKKYDTRPSPPPSVVVAKDLVEQVDASLIISLALSSESLVSSIGTSEKTAGGGGLGPSIDEFISQTNVPIGRRKPNLPISSKTTSRVFTLYENDTTTDATNCDSRSLTPISIDSSNEESSTTTTTANDAVASSKLFGQNRLCLCTSTCPHLRTSRVSLLSNESLPSLVSGPESERSSSCSPLEHWAKHPPPSNRLSTSSHSSWEDGGSDIHEVT